MLGYNEIVRAATDLVELIGSERELRRAGRGWATLCPWHRDTRPSLQINTEKQIWRCWVCDVGGDCFEWIMRTRAVSFPESLEILADRAGIAMQKSSGRLQKKAGLLSAMDWAVDLYRKQLQLPESAAAKYLESRGISRESIDRWKLGVAPESWTFLVDASTASGHSFADLETAGLVGTSAKGRRYDRFRQRVIFPISDKSSRVIALGGRVLPGSDVIGGKYINSPETPLFSKQKQLYGLDLARDGIRRSGRSIVVEGYTDVILCHQSGLDNVVACMGVALTADHVRQLRYLADEVVLLLDGDEAGRKRAGEVLRLLVGSPSRVLSLPDGLDPADFISQHGADELRTMIDRADDPILYQLKQLCTGFNPREESSQSRVAMEQMLDLVKNCEDIDIELTIRRLCTYFGVRENVLLRMLAARRRRDSQASTSPEITRLPMSEQESSLIRLLVLAPQIALPPISDRIEFSRVSDATRGIIEAYERRELAGQDLAVECVMPEVLDPGHRSVLARIIERIANDHHRTLGFSSAAPAIEKQVSDLLAVMHPESAPIAENWDELLDSIESI